MRIDVFGAAAFAFTNSPKLVPQLRGRAGARFGDVNLPIMIERVRDIDANAGKLVMLFLGPAETQPVPGDEETSIAVDVKALVGIPSAWAGYSVVSGFRDLRVMRENKRLNFNNRVPQLEPRGRQCLCRGLVRQKWIPGLHNSPVDENVYGMPLRHMAV